VKELKVKVGDKVSQGVLVLTARVEEAGAAAARAAACSACALLQQPRAGPGTTVSRCRRTGFGRRRRPRPHLAAMPPSTKPLRQGACEPVVRRFARELGVDSGPCQGSGPKGRILKEDVQAFVKQTLSAPQPREVAAGGGRAGLGLLPWPQVDFSKFGPTDAGPFAHQEALRRKPASQLGHDPSRHAA
jgi:pyruvate dehydrogenase E2 component (dihydrolipoamide acetyltransferase)